MKLVSEMTELEKQEACSSGYCPFFYDYINGEYVKVYLTEEEQKEMFSYGKEG